MPVYMFESADGDVVEQQFGYDGCPRAIEVDGKPYRKIIAPVAVLIPDHMRAPGSSRSNADSIELNKRYLNSAKHVQDREQTERIYERTKNAQDGIQAHLKKELGDPAKVKAKVEKRRHERKQMGLTP